MFPVDESQAVGVGSDLSSASLQLAEALLRLLERLFQQIYQKKQSDTEEPQPHPAIEDDPESGVDFEPGWEDDPESVEFDALASEPEVDNSKIASPLGEFRIFKDGEPVSANAIEPSLIELIEQAGQLTPGAELSGVGDLQVMMGEQTVLELSNGTVVTNEAVALSREGEEPASPARTFETVATNLRDAAAESGLKRVAQGVRGLDEPQLEELLKDVLSEVSQLRAALMKERGVQHSEVAKGSDSPVGSGKPTSSLWEGFVLGDADAETARTIRDFFEDSAVQQNRLDTADYTIERSGKSYRIANRDGNELMRFRDTFWGGVKVESVSGDRDARARLGRDASLLKEQRSLGQQPTGAFSSAGRSDAVRLARSIAVADSLVGIAALRGGRVQIDGQEQYRFLATADGGVRIDAKDGRGTIFYRSPNGETTNLMRDRDLAYFEELAPKMQFRAWGSKKTKERDAQLQPASRSRTRSHSPVKSSPRHQKKGGLEL